MSRGKYLSLEEALREKQLKRFAKEHPSKGDKEVFDRLLDAMTNPRKPKEGEKTSTAERRACCI